MQENNIDNKQENNKQKEKSINMWYVINIILFISFFLTYKLGSIYDYFFSLMPINPTIILIVFVLAIDSFYIYKIITLGITKIFHHFDETIKIESDINRIK